MWTTGTTAPQAFFCPDRRFPTPARAEAVKVGRRSAIAAHSAVSRPRLDSFEHGGRLDDHGPEERSVVESGLLWFLLAWIDVAARSTVLYAVQGRWPHHGPQGFDAAMPRTHSTKDRRRKNRAVVEARPSRDSIPPRDAAKGYFDWPQTAGDAASAFHWNVVPVVHMRCRMTASLRATAMVAFLAPMRVPRASPQVLSAIGRPDRLSNTLAACTRRQRTMPSPNLEIRPA